MSECLIDSERKHIIAEYLTYDDKDKELLDMQEGKEFYIPDYREVLDYAKNLYLSEEPAYEKLKNFFHLEMNMSNREASEETEEIWERFSFGIGFERNIKRLLRNMRICWMIVSWKHCLHFFKCNRIPECRYTGAILDE